MDGIKVRTGQLLGKISELASGLKQGSYDSSDIFVLGILRNVFKNYFNYVNMCMCPCMSVGVCT